MTRYISFISLSLVTLGLITATVVEKYSGTPTALSCCYHSPWMIALWVICAVTGLVTVIAQRSAMTVAVLSLHLSLIVILAGAAVTHYCGEHGSVTLHEGKSVSTFTLSDSSATRSLPFSLSLIGCGVEYYPGTHSPRDYYTTVEITDSLGSASRHRISMNRTLDIHGYRFCQSGLAGDSSTLSVNHDPWGIGITFAGYGLLFAAMAAALIERNGRFRLNLRRLMAAGLMAWFTASPAGATDSMPETLQRPLAKTFGTLYISHNGRIQPVQTFARDFCMTVSGKDNYKGLSPEQVLTGWIFYYDSWKHEPMIRLKSRRAREAMDGRTYVSLTDLYTGGIYRLQHLIETHSDDRDLLADDNRVTLITTVCTGNALTTLPVTDPSDSTLTWYSWADRLPSHADSEATQSFASTLSSIYYDINHGQFRHANDELKHLRRLQESMAGNTLPSATAINAERLYNNSFYPLLSAVLTLILGLISLIAYLYEYPYVRRLTAPATWAVFAYTTYIIILRWIVGGHIPLVTGYETMLALAWIALGLSLWCGRRVAVMAPLGIIVAGASLLVAMMGSSNPAMSTLMPVLASRLLSLHVMLVMTSYALFGIIALAAAIGLLSRPRRERMSIVCITLLVPALFLLGAGIFTGAIWANQSWGRYWGWDPKETWALVTFFIYAMPLHSSSLSFFRSHKILLRYLLVAFLSVLMTYLGVNYLLSGLHSYGVA